MKLQEIFSEDCIQNILGHIRCCWTYSSPTSKTLEEAIYRGIKPFYDNIRDLGGPTTIVDIAKGTQALDIKGGQQLGHLKVVGKAQNQDTNIFVEQIMPGAGKIKVRIPKNVDTIIRRPGINLQSFTMEPKQALTECVQEYKTFAEKTTKEAECDSLFTIFVLYGMDEKKGYKSIFLTLEEFFIPEIKKYNISTKEDGVSPQAYLGLDSSGSVIYKLVPFNQSSTNSYKKFDTSRGVLYTWPIEESDPIIYTKEMNEKDGSIKII
jgi:hypothetical protein